MESTVPTVHRVMLRISNLVTTRATSGGMSLAVAFLALIPSQLVAGGPKYVAGVNFFNPGVVGQPVRWQSGLVQYFVDQGPLIAAVDHQQATAMVDAAAAVWSASPLLATQVATAISALDGTVVFTPASMPGIPTSLVGVAATGNSSTLPVALERYP